MVAQGLETRLHIVIVAVEFPEKNYPENMIPFFGTLKVMNGTLILFIAHIPRELFSVEEQQ